MGCLQNTVCLSLEFGMPTVASVPYSILLAFANLLAVAADTEHTFKGPRRSRRTSPTPRHSPVPLQLLLPLLVVLLPPLLSRRRRRRRTWLLLPTSSTPVTTTK